MQLLKYMVPGYSLGYFVDYIATRTHVIHSKLVISYFKKTLRVPKGVLPEPGSPNVFNQGAWITVILLLGVLIFFTVERGAPCLEFLEP